LEKAKKQRFLEIKEGDSILAQFIFFFYPCFFQKKNLNLYRNSIFKEICL
jgi:hypothetical protein